MPRLAVGRGVPERARPAAPRDGRHVLQVGRGGPVRLRRARPRSRDRGEHAARSGADAYAFRIGPRLAEIAERLGEQVPGAVVDFDVTEGGRAVGLAFLTAGRYFLVNNGPYYQNYDVPIDPRKDNWNLFFHKGPARTWITRSTYGYDKWIPAELFLTHYFPDDPEDAQLVDVASLILGHDGIWGDLALRLARGRRALREAPRPLAAGAGQHGRRRRRCGRERSAAAARCTRRSSTRRGAASSWSSRRRAAGSATSPSTRWRPSTGRPRARP